MHYVARIDSFRHNCVDAPVISRGWRTIHNQRHQFPQQRARAKQRATGSCTHGQRGQPRYILLSIVPAKIAQEAMANRIIDAAHQGVRDVVIWSDDWGLMSGREIGPLNPSATPGEHWRASPRAHLRGLNHLPHCRAISRRPNGDTPPVGQHEGR